MEEGLCFAAIDVGSNAMRLFFCRVLENSHGPTFVKESMIRMPLRLGHDAFTAGTISKDTCDRFVDTMHGFKALVRAYDPITFKACATSAMRQAKNGMELVGRVKNETGIDLNIISGKEEARMIFRSIPVSTFTRPTNSMPFLACRIADVAQALNVIGS
jgi:exopolyphosphatase/guanosine-5'-triphosphate,3'-diphosphate pyrophosphatase